MASVVLTPNSDDKHEYEFRAPVIFSKDEKGDRAMQLQSPIHKVDDSTVFKLQSPIKKEDDEDGKKITLQSPVEKIDKDADSVKIKFRPR